MVRVAATFSEIDIPACPTPPGYSLALSRTVQRAECARPVAKAPSDMGGGLGEIPEFFGRVWIDGMLFVRQFERSEKLLCIFAGDEFPGTHQYHLIQAVIHQVDTLTIRISSS